MTARVTIATEGTMIKRNLLIMIETRSSRLEMYNREGPAIAASNPPSVVKLDVLQRREEPILNLWNTNSAKGAHPTESLKSLIQQK